MTKHINRILLLLVTPIIPFTGYGQQFFTSSEYGIALGAANYFGDLNPNYGFNHVRPSAGAFYRYHVNPYIALKGMVNYAKVGYEDNYSNNAYQKIRNLSFRSDVVEASVVAEFNFFWFATGETNRRFTPYLVGGLGAFYYEPYVKYLGERYNLRSLGTEGQRTSDYGDRKYKPYSLCFPIGAGIKYWIRPGMNLGVEIANRFTLTDYLDDVSNTYAGSRHFYSDPMRPSVASQLQDRSTAGSDGQKLGREGKQRGDNSTKDQYLLIQVSLSLQFKTYKCPTNFGAEWQ